MSLFETKKMAAQIFSLLLLVSLFLVSCSNTFKLEKFENRENLEQKILQNMQDEKIPGLSLVIGHQDSILWERHFGFGDLAKQLPVSDSTDFEWFSITKLFTATAILKLHEKGYLDLDDPVADYLKYFSPIFEDKIDPDVTIKHLLTHTSGLNDKEWKSATWLQTSQEYEKSNREEFPERIFSKYERLRSEPGTEYQYSNLGYILLGEIVKTVSEQPLEHFVESRILDTLNLATTYYDKPNATSQFIAFGYERTFSVMGLTYRMVAFLKRANIHKTKGYIKIDDLYAPHHGYIGLRGSARDLATFASVFANGNHPTPLLADSTFRLMKKKHFQINKSRWMGLGWQILKDFHGEFIRHIGGGPGFKAEVRVYDDGTYIVIMGNTSFDIWNYSNLLIYNYHLFQKHFM